MCVSMLDLPRGETARLPAGESDQVRMGRVLDTCDAQQQALQPEREGRKEGFYKCAKLGVLRNQHFEAIGMYARLACVSGQSAGWRQC